MSLPVKTLKLTVNQSPELLERILRVVRHRGFMVNYLEWENDSSELLLTVSSQRALHLLTAQLTKLIDVHEVRHLTNSQHIKSA